MLPVSRDVCHSDNAPRSPDVTILVSCAPAAVPLSMVSLTWHHDGRTPIVLLTPWTHDTTRIAGAQLGSEQCIVEQFGPDELIARLRTLMDTALPGYFPVAYGPTDRLAFGSVRIDIPSCAVTRDGVPVPLTAKEFDLLLALIRKRGAVASRAALLQEVWGYRSHVVTRTVDIHIAELRRKLEPVPSKPRYLVTVRSRGYRFVDA